MGKVLPFKRPQAGTADAVREQAAAWIARLDAGAAEADLQEIRAWLGRDPAHAKVLLEFAQLWDRMDVLGQLATMFPLDHAGRLRRRRRWPRAALAAAAACLVLGAGLMAWLPPEFSAPAAVPRNFTASYRTAVGEQRTVELVDGSRIVLNTDSRIEIVYRDESRHIELLSGEGLFDVAKDAARPFRVQAGQHMVEAVGTAFSVHRAAGDGIEVLVSEGRVLVHGASVAGGGSLPLNAGQYAALTAEETEAVAIDISTDQLEARLSWQHGMLLFRDEPLAEVLARVDRYTTLDIEADPAVADLRVAGYYRVDDIEGMLAAFDSNFDIDIQRSDNAIRLVPQ